MSARVLLLLLCGCPIAAAQEPSQVPPQVPPAGPRIALVLSSGGVRGLAHIGVLQALEEQGIEVDLIVGSEWGALVGGLYAAGLTPDEIQRELLAPNFLAAIQDRRLRQTLSFRSKEVDREFLFDLPLGLDKRGLILPPGLRVGDGLRLELARMTLGTLDMPSFDDLPWPFRAMATEFKHGASVPLASGSLALAIEASVAYPVLWPPVLRNGELLISGTVSDPLPIDVAFAAGAERLILVDLGDPEAEPGAPTFLSAGQRVLDIAWSRKAAEARAKLRPEDLLCTPEVQGVDFTELEVGLQLIERGREAGRALAARLAPLALDRGTFEEHVLRRRSRAKQEPIIDHVHVDPTCSLSANSVRARLEIRPGEALDTQTASLDLARLYGLRLFQRVDFELQSTTPGHADLLVRTEDLPTTPLHWRTGLTAELSAGRAVNFQIGAEVRWAPTDSWGSEGRLQLEAGNRLAALLEYRQALEPSGKWFVVPAAQWQKNPVVVNPDGGAAAAQYSVEELDLSLDLVREFGRDWEVRAGYLSHSGNSQLEFGDPTTNPTGSFNEAGFRTRLTCDSLDDTAFPSDGTFLRTEWFRPSNSGEVGHDESVATRFDHALHWGRDTFVVGAELDTVLSNQASVQSFFPLGGFLRLSGLPSEAVSGPTAALARVVYIHPLQTRSLKPGIFTWYAGGSLELGDVFNEWRDITLSGLHPAGSAFLGVDTIIGPAYLGFGLIEGGQTNVFLVFGRVF
jgi:NTE family protein